MDGTDTQVLLASKPVRALRVPAGRMEDFLFGDRLPDPVIAETDDGPRAVHSVDELDYQPKDWFGFKIRCHQLAAAGRRR